MGREEIPVRDRARALALLPWLLSAPFLEACSPRLTEKERAALLPITEFKTLKSGNTTGYDDFKAAALGKRFFFDPRFSGPLLESDNDGSKHTLGRKGEVHKVSCAGCHMPESGFVDTRTLNVTITLASAWTRRKTPSLLNTAHAGRWNWDGSASSLHAQAVGPLENPSEMNGSRLYTAQQVSRHYRTEYETLFGRLPRFDDPHLYPQIKPEHNGCKPPFGVNPEDCKVAHPEYDRLSASQKREVDLTIENWGKALASYLRRLKSQPTRVDAYLEGDTSALSSSEVRGLKVFAGKGRCLECHSGPLLTDQKFHNLGIKAEYVAVVFLNPYDPGAGEGRFKTPSLRNSGSLSFMHTGQFRSLKQVIEFLDRGGDRDGFVGKSELKPLGLSAQEKTDLEALLLALRSPPAPDGL